MANVKVISIMQPWAHVVAMGVKKIETRSWKTDYRGELYIHASQKYHRGVRMVAGSWPFRNHLKLMAHELPLGSILGKVILEDIKTTRELKQFNLLSEEERAMGDYSDGRYGWIMRDAVLFDKPIPAKGSLSIWNFELMEMEVANG